MMIRLAEGPLHTLFGTFQEVLYYDGQQESIALVMGQVAQGQDIFCRMHSQCLAAHVFNSLECDCREQMALAQSVIEQQGCGIIIWLNQEGRGNGHLALMRSRALQAQGWSQTEAYRRLGYAADARQYMSAAEILRIGGLFDPAPHQQSPESGALAGGGNPHRGHSSPSGGSWNQRVAETTLRGENPTRPSHSLRVHVGDGGIR